MDPQFPTKLEMHDFCQLWHRLSTDGGLVLKDGRIAVPKFLWKKVLCCLHLAHQGVVCMKARANDSVYWPGINASVRICIACSSIASIQLWEPVIITQSTDWPFQQILMNFYVGHFAYFVCADRLTGWLILYHLKPGHAITSKLIPICLGLFHSYGTPDELSSDGDPPFISSLIQQFLKTWCVKHRLSLVTYPQCDGKGKLIPH